MATVVFDALIPRAMEYVKFRDVLIQIPVVIFRFGRNYHLVLAWMYASHRGPAPVSLV